MTLELTLLVLLLLQLLPYSLSTPLACGKRPCLSRGEHLRGLCFGETWLGLPCELLCSQQPLAAPPPPSYALDNVLPSVIWLTKPAEHVAVAMGYPRTLIRNHNPLLAQDARAELHITSLQTAR